MSPKFRLVRNLVVFYCVWFILIIPRNISNAGDIYLPMIMKPCSDFFDDFGNTASGWEATDDVYAKTEYLNGEYRILLKQPGFKISHPKGCPRENYSVEADIRLVNGIGVAAGIIFGASSIYDRFYVVVVLPNEGLFEILRHNSDGSNVMISENISSAIFRGGSVNHLKVARQGSAIAVYINGIKMGTWYDSNITGMTYIGLFAGSDIIMDARFDNFRVLNLTAQ